MYFGGVAGTRLGLTSACKCLKNSEQPSQVRKKQFRNRRMSKNDINADISFIRVIFSGTSSIAEISHHAIFLYIFLRPKLNNDSN